VWQGLLIYVRNLAQTNKNEQPTFQEDIRSFSGFRRSRSQFEMFHLNLAPALIVELKDCDLKVSITTRYSFVWPTAAKK
jgi:hypothetical protein